MGGREGGGERVGGREGGGEREGKLFFDWKFMHCVGYRLQYKTIELYQPLISCHGTRLSSLGRRVNKICSICSVLVDGIEGHYSRELSIKYSSYDHIVVSFLHKVLLHSIIS